MAVHSMTDILAALDPTVIYVMEPEPGWVWARCPICHECRYQRRVAKLGRCRVTPKCEGVMVTYLELVCVACAKPVTARRVGHDTDFCSQKCEKAVAA